MFLAKLKNQYIKYCQFAQGTDRISALRLAMWNGRTDIHIRPKGANAAVLIRADSSDIDVFAQIFIQEEYASLLSCEAVDLVVDAGANVGYSSVYFLCHFPGCQVVAIEPDPANFAALRHNLAPYAERARMHNRAIWSKPAQLAIESNVYRDGREWTRQVRECDPGEVGDVAAMTIGEVLAQSGRERLSLVKMDIEGAEAVVFADATCQAWLRRTDALAIELHDDTSFGEASTLFHQAIRPHPFRLSHSGELTICQRSQGLDEDG